MAGSFSDYTEAKLLDYLFSGAAFTPPATLYVALYTTQPTDAGGGVEVTGGAYARVAVTNNNTNFPAATGTSPTVKNNGTVFTFTTATANWGTVTAWGLFDASSAGNLIAWSRLLFNPKVVTADNTTDVFTSTAHGFTNGQSVEIESLTGAVPTGLSAQTEYFIVTAAANTFQLALTSGGAAINFTSDGTGTLQVALRYVKAVNNGDTPSFAVSNLQVTLD